MKENRQYYWKVFTEYEEKYHIDPEDYAFFKNFYLDAGWPEMLEDMENYLLEKGYN